MTPENDFSELSTKLNDLLSSIPESIDKLESWEYDLRIVSNNMIDKGANTNEINTAGNLLQRATELLDIHAVLDESQRKISEGYLSQDVINLKKLIRVYDSQILNLTSFKQRGRDFPVIVKWLFDQAENAKSQAEHAKAEIDAILEVFNTWLMVDKQVELLDEINKLFETKGINKFPVAQNSDETESKSEANARITGIIFIATKKAIIDHLQILEKYNRDESGYFQPKTNAEFDLIYSEMNYIQELFRTKYVASDLSKEKELNDRFNPLMASAKSIFIQREETRRKLESLDVSTPEKMIEALIDLDSASYRLLPELGKKIESLRDRYLQKKNADIGLIWVGHAEACNKRDYDAFLAALRNSQSAIRNVNPPGKVYVNVDDLIQKIDGYIEEVDDEYQLWQEFTDLRDQLLPLIEQKRVDKTVQNRLTDHSLYASWKKLFNIEVIKLESSLKAEAEDMQVIQQVRELYRKDPSNQEIIELLTNKEGKKISVASKFYDEAQAYLQACNCHISAKAIRSICANGGLILADANDWWNKLQLDFAGFTNTSGELLLTKFDTLPDAMRQIKPNIDGLADDIKLLTQQAKDLKTLWEKVVIKKKTNFVEASKLIEGKLSAPYAEEVATSYQSLNEAMRREWRESYLTKIETLIGSESPSRSQLDEAYQLMQELDQYELLVQDGDLGRKTTVNSKYHLFYLMELLGDQKTLEDYEDKDLICVGQKHNLNWNQLLLHLDKLQGNPSFNSETTIILSRLRILALSHVGLVNDRETSKKRLKTELENLPSLSDAVSIYVTLTLRYLESEADYQLASELVIDLKNIGSQTALVADALTRLVDAHHKQQAEDITAAVSDLRIGLESLKKLLPALELALEENVNSRVSNWYSMYAEHILAETARITRGYRTRTRFPEDQYFKVYANLNEASEYASNDGRFIEGRRVLDKFADEIGSGIMKKVNKLLTDQNQGLREKVKDSDQLSQYLATAFGSASFYMPETSEWDELRINYETFLEDYKNWKNAWEELLRLRNKIKDLWHPDASWIWTNNQKMSPFSDFINVTKGLNQITDWLGTYQPAELNHFTKFLTDFRTGNSALAVQMQQLVNLANKDQDFNNAIIQLKDMRKKRDELQKVLVEGAPLGLEEPVSINLDMHYRIENQNDKIEKSREGWRIIGKGDPITGLSNINTYLMSLEKNRNEWSVRKEKLLSCCGSLYKNLKAARLAPNIGQLSKAANLCRGDKSKIPDELKFYEDPEKRNVIPTLILDVAALDSEIEKAQPPLTLRALEEGAPSLDDEFSPSVKTAELQQAWADLLKYEDYLNNIELNLRWMNYLTQVVGCAMLDCGISPELLSDFPGLQSRIEIVKLDKPRIPINTLIDSKSKELKSLITEIDNHIQRYKAKPVFPRSQEILLNMLIKAQSIDTEAPRIEGSRKIYEHGKIALENNVGKK